MDFRTRVALVFVIVVVADMASIAVMYYRDTATTASTVAGLFVALLFLVGAIRILRKS